MGNRRRILRTIVGTLILAGAGFAGHLGVEFAWLSKQPVVQARMVASSPSPGGALLICGGGKVIDPIRDRFVEMAGGPRARIVLIPSASPTADRPELAEIMDVWKLRKPSSVSILHTRSRDVADDPKFSQPLADATGVWFGGGDQCRLAETYLGTAVERQLMALLDRGGVIGGTSAGAAVMTRVMITRGRTKASVGAGFDFLPGAVVDQHFLRRNRMKRLVSVLVEHPELVGIGIDERTALEVRLRERQLRVIGESYVFACVPDAAGSAPRLEILKPGDEANLAALKKADGQAIVSAIDFKSL